MIKTGIKGKDYKSSWSEKRERQVREERVGALNAAFHDVRPSRAGHRRLVFDRNMLLSAPKGTLSLFRR